MAARGGVFGVSGARGVLVGLCALVVVVLAALPSVAAASDAKLAFAVEPGSFKVVPSSDAAGAHADLTTSFAIEHDRFSETAADMRNVVVNLPVGFVGDPLSVATCTQAQLLTQEGTARRTQCPFDSQIGTITITMNSSGVPQTGTVPLYNMQLIEPGAAAEFGFNFNGILTQLLLATVRPGDSGITVTTPNIAGSAEVSKVSVTVWGVPGDPGHDPERGQECLAGVCKGGGVELTGSPRPYLINPTSCASGPLHASIEVDSWAKSSEWSTQEAAVEPMVECERVPFAPSILARPPTGNAESASGLDLSFVVAQSWDDPITIGTANLDDSTVSLPVGYTVNPSEGNGLVGCTVAELERETPSSLPGAGCPEASKIGTVLVETPVLSEALSGSVFIAQPYANRFHSLLAMYIVIKDLERGIVVTLQGKVTPDPVTGQLVASFQEAPQVPFSRFTIRLSQSATSPLVSPPVCGNYTVTAGLTPWSAPTEAHMTASSFSIEHGIGGGPCPAGGVPPFKPTVVAGTQNNAAGSFSPFYLRIERQDGEQEITGFSTQMPPGLTGDLAGIPFCPDADIARARTQSGGEAQAAPACPAASQIGSTIAEAGVGSVLAQTPGRLYLAGPFEGAPFSVVDVTSAKVGPFDLGTVVVHLPLRIDPLTAQVSIPSGPADQIPHIIDGIVIHLRDIRVYIDRPDFMINPTSCDPTSVSASVIGAGADPTNPAGYDPVTVTDRFQDADCASLAFKPTFKVRTSAHTSRTQGASLDTIVSTPAGSLGKNANIKSVKVDLPYQLPSRLTTLQKACTSKQFEADPAGCPAPSRVGTAVVHTPIVPVPLTGPAYFVSYGAAKFPELIVVLQGYGITIELHGETFIGKRGITSTTFRSVPDEPFESFELNLPQGPYSALTNNGNLCKVTRTKTVKKRVKVKRKNGKTRVVTRKVRKKVAGKLLMPTALTGQNGTVIHETNTIAVTGCPKAHRTKSKAKHKKKKGKKKK